MPFIPKIFPSSSPPPSFHSFSANGAPDSISDRRQCCAHCRLTRQRKLTRQKKLRRVSPPDLALQPTAPPDSAEISPSLVDSLASPVRSDLKALDLAEPAARISQPKTPDRSPNRSQSLQISSPSPQNGKKLGFSSPKKWPESSISSAHPLPLPPEATLSCMAVPLPPPISHHKQECSNVSLWQKGKFIGRGTFSSVYVGTNRETGALCAIKEVYIIPDDPKSAECIKQMEQEIRLLQFLEHPNIVQYYGSEIVDDHFFIYMEYVYPGSIRKYVSEYSGVLTESIIRNFTRHILSGLAYLHSKRTIHRDIKGANLLVDTSGVVKLADFGMAKHISGLSFKLSLKGSPHWMAPEVIKAVMQKDANPDLALAVDIWSLGCTIIEMFSGKPPWGDIEGPQAMFKVLTGSPPIPESLSPEAKDFLQCCFQRNPAERPSASMLLDHAFVKCSSEHILSTCRQDKSRTSRECAARNNDSMPASPNTRGMKEKLCCNRISIPLFLSLSHSLTHRHKSEYGLCTLLVFLCLHQFQLFSPFLSLSSPSKLPHFIPSAAAAAAAAMSMPVTQQQPPAVTIAQNSFAPQAPPAAIGPLIAVLVVILILGIAAVMIGRICSGRKILGYGHYDIESWAETHCGSCIDGRISPPPPPPAPPVQPAAAPQATNSEIKNEEEDEEDEDQISPQQQ